MNKGFSYYFCLMIEGSGSGSTALTNGSGSGFRRPKNIRIRIWIRIRIRNTGFKIFFWRLRYILSNCTVSLKGTFLQFDPCSLGLLCKVL
jgi:hypothetical protein